MMNGKVKAEKVTDVAAIKKRIEEKDIRSTLVSIIDASEDLLTELVGEEVLDDSSKDDILAGSTRTEVNKRLLNWIISNDDISTFETFLAKLRQHRQNHVANLLDGTPGEQPLTTKRRQNIQKIMGDLTKSIDPNKRLLDSLVSAGAISETACAEITAERTKPSRTRALLNSLLRGSDKAFDKFLDILMKYQPLARGIIDKQEGETTKPHAETVKGNYEVLKRCTDISLVTIAFLRAMSVIDMDMENELRLQQGLEKVTLMYRWLVLKPVEMYQAFIRAMQENEQNHVANLLSKTSSGQQPMSSEKFDRLIRQRPHLMQGIHSTGILLASALRGQQASEDTDFAISKTDYEDITEGDKTNTIRNSVLIDAVLRRTDFSFDSLREALRETNQEHMANLMIEGEIVGAHINTDRPEREDDLSRLLNDLIADPKSCEEKPEIKKCFNELNGFRVPIVSAEAKHSIMLYTYCKTPEDMKSYVRLLNSGRLQTVFENILNLLLKELEGENFQPLQAAVMIEEEDRMLIQQFTGLDENETDFKHLPIISSKTCSVHDYPVNIYCFDCKMGICSSCVNENHQSHNHSDVQNIQICETPDNICEQLQQDLALVSSYKSTSLQWKEKIEKEREQMILSMEESEKNVLRRCEDLKQRVERFQEVMLQNHAAFKQQMLYEMDIRQRAIESYVAVYNGYEEHTKNLMEHGSPSEICQSFFGLHERAHKLQQLPEPLINKEFFEKTNEWINRMPRFAVQVVGIIPTVGMAQVVHQEIPQPQRSYIEQQRKFLEDFMDPFNGLLEELSLPRKDVKRVDSEHTLQKKNAKLLDYITKNDKDKELIRALKDTKQSHIVNFLNSNGVYNPQFGGDWPLNIRELQILADNRKNLVDQLQLRHLLDKLQAAEVISKKQKDFISDKSSFRERNEALLDLLKRGSQDNYKKMVGCLLASDQRNIVQILAPPQVNVTICLDVGKELTELVGSVNQLIAAY
jgi:hypothetical protein